MTNSLGNWLARNSQTLLYTLTGLLVIALLARLGLQLNRELAMAGLALGMGGYGLAHLVLGSRLMDLPHGSGSLQTWVAFRTANWLLESLYRLGLGLAFFAYLNQEMWLGYPLAHQSLQIGLLLLVGALVLLPGGWRKRRGHALQLAPLVVFVSPVFNPTVDRALVVGLVIVGVLLYDRLRGFGLHGQALGFVLAATYL